MKGRSLRNREAKGQGDNTAGAPLHPRPGAEQRSSGSPPTPAHCANAGISALRDGGDHTHATSCLPPAQYVLQVPEKLCPGDHQHPSQHHHLQHPSHPKPYDALVSPQHAPRQLTRAGSTCFSLLPSFQALHTGQAHSAPLLPRLNPDCDHTYSYSLLEPPTSRGVSELKGGQDVYIEIYIDIYIYTHTFMYINIVEAELDQRSANERGQQERRLFVVCAGTADGRAAFQVHLNHKIGLCAGNFEKPERKNKNIMIIKTREDR